jgi:hypothetical protein
MNVKTEKQYGHTLFKVPHYGHAMTQAVKSPASHHRGLCLHPAQSMWDLWWTKQNWYRLFSEFFGFPLSESFHQAHTHVSSGGCTTGQLVAAVQRRTLTSSTWTTWTIEKTRYIPKYIWTNMRNLHNKSVRTDGPQGENWTWNQTANLSVTMLNNIHN